jgi:hypothetical protein
VFRSLLAGHNLLVAAMGAGGRAAKVIALDDDEESDKKPGLLKPDGQPLSVDRTVEDVEGEVLNIVYKLLPRVLEEKVSLFAGRKGPTLKTATLVLPPTPGMAT